MDLHQAVLTRRTIQRYDGTPVARDALDRALEAAHHAPCHKLTWPWRFTVLGPEGRRFLVDLAVRLNQAKKKDRPPEQVEATVRGRLGSAGTLVVVSQVLAADAFRREEDYAATACAIQNLCLSLHADGYGTKWSTGGFTRHPDTYERLGIDADRERIVGVVLAGTPCAEVKTPPRPELQQVVRRLA